MSRPQKAGIDYFPLDTDIDQDDKIALIEAKHGLIGFGVIIKLFKKIYSSNGYYYEWTEETQLLFSKKIGVEFELLNEIIEDAIRWGLFDKRLFDEYKILTSKRIQRTYLQATTKRKEVEIIREYVANGVNDYENRVNVVINSINSGNNPQSKVKESKVKKKESNTPTPYQKIQDTYNQNRGNLPEVKILSDNRKDAIRLRYKKYGLDKLTALFEKAGKSDFLNGKNDRNWKANFDWLIKEANMVKVLEGNYDNKDKPIGKKYERVT